MAEFEDTFTDTAGTALENHTPDTGTGWALITGSTSVYQIEDNGDKLEAVNSANDGYHCDDLSSADHITILRMADIAQDSAMRDMFVCARLTDNNNLIGWRWYGTGSLGSRVTKVDGGTYTDLITEDGGTEIQNGWVKVEAEGDTIRLFHGGTGSSPTWGTAESTVTETFNNTVTRQGVVKNGGALLGQEWITDFQADTFSTGTTDSALITSATASVLQSTDSTTATEAASITAAVASVIAATDTAQSTDSAQTTNVSAAVLSSTDTSAATDTASVTASSAAILTATAQAIATDAAAIITAAATPLTSSETTSSTQATDSAVITTVGAATLTATESAVSTDGATITPASVTIQTSAETATALDNAVIVNAQGTPLASIESVKTDANITTVTVTPLTSVESADTAQFLLGEPQVEPILTADPRMITVLSASPEVVAQLRARPSIKPE